MTAAEQLKVASIGPTLEFDKVSLTLGRTVILDAVSFQVQPGSIHALVGPNGGGKSSLMNLIVGREASIVSSEAGTTRDIVEASLDIRGYLCSFADTAGIRTMSSSELGGWLDGCEHNDYIRIQSLFSCTSNALLLDGADDRLFGGSGSSG